MKTGRPRKYRVKKCKVCGRSFYNPNHQKTQIYCSRKCWIKSMEGKKPSKNNLRKVRSSEANLKRSQSLKGIKRSKDWRVKVSKRMKGKNCNFWKGGKSNYLYRLRRSLKYKLWREKVFKRDNYTCQKCSQRGGNLHPHHIKSFAKYPQLRFVVSNGKTLCEKCHKQTKSYLNND